MRYAIDFLVGRERHSAVVDAPHATAAVAALMAKYGVSHFHLLSLRVAELAETNETTPEQTAPPSLSQDRPPRQRR